MIVVLTQVQPGVRIEVGAPYSANFPESCATLIVDWGRARGVVVQLSKDEARVLAVALTTYAGDE